MPTIAIIGAGFSGSMLAVNLLHQPDTHLRIVLIEKRQRFGRGLAYSTDNPAHLLNVPAGRMGAFAANPGHFLDWLNSRPETANSDGQAYGPGSFVPRHLYGDYLATLLGQAAKSNPTDRFQRINAQATDLSTVAGNVQINLSNSATITADHAVLALGNFPSLPPVAALAAASDRYIADPWQAGALDRIPLDAVVLLVGSGLTMADMAIALIAKGHRGRLDAISRHGLLPHRHAAPPPDAPVVPPFTIDEIPFTARGLARTVRSRIRGESATGWRSVIDALRPVTQELWRRAPRKERARFLRHLQARWDVHRHRLAPAAAAKIDAMRSSGQLHFHAGRVTGLDATSDGLAVHFRSRGSAELATLVTHYVVNCTGPASDYSRIDDPLVRNLLERGLARPDPLHLGLDIDDRQHLIARDGAPSERLYAAGPPTKGAAWEITAVPDLRVQSMKLADYLAATARTLPPRAVNESSSPDALARDR
jgi:uncharacterized NAD(P)/FAD-binding protein YdhS